MKHQGEIIAHTEVAPGYYLMEVHCPPVAVGSQPGQFVHIRCAPTFDPLLRRPLSLHRLNRDAGSFSLLYQVRGKGTRLLSELRPGQELDLMGPLGNGFNLDLDRQGKNGGSEVGSAPAGKLNHGDVAAGPGLKVAVLVAGGIGAAPLVCLAEDLLRTGRRVVFLAGARSAGDQAVAGILTVLAREHEDFQAFFCTDDGSMGRRGLVTELLAEVLTSYQVGAVYACGPETMLKLVGDTCLSRAIPGQISLESRMACGVGACLGCTCRVSGASGYVKVCHDGPVFNIGEVEW